MPAMPAIDHAVCCAAAVAWGLVASGCGSSGPGTSPAAAPSAPSVTATPPLTPDDTAVASVNGRPVWASCVAAQAQARAASSAQPAASVAQQRAAALEQCVAFELLAQAAEARGLAAAPEVAEAVRTAGVNRLVETEFEQRYRTPADFAPQIDAVMKANAWRLHVPELRSSTFARFAVPKDAPPELDARAHALADRLAAELAGQAGLFSVHLTEAAQRIDAGTGIKLDTSDFRLAQRGELVETYAAALFAIPEIGRISPAFRTPWGWDVVLWTGGAPAHERSRDKAIAELLPELQRRQFQRWVNQLGKQLGVHIEVDQAAVARLDAEGAP